MSQQLEKLEQRALKAIHAAAGGELKQTLGLSCPEFAGASVSCLRQAPASAIVMNRCIGLGIEKAARREDIVGLCEHYRAMGIARYFVHVHPNSQPGNLTHWLEEQGLEKTRSWVKFVRDNRPAKVPNTDLEVRLARPEEMPRVAEILSDAFDLGPDAASLMAHLHNAPGWQVFVSLDKGKVAGTGSLFINDNYAWFDWGATDPSYRQRGSQSALLETRIAHAIESECHTLATCTGEEVEGDPQHSYKNIKRAGFNESYIRDNYALPRQ